MAFENDRCTICGNLYGNKVYKIKERMLNRGEAFSYLLCKKCGTLSLVDKVEDKEHYYDNYPVFQNDKVITFNKLTLVYANILLSELGKYIKAGNLDRYGLGFLNCLLGLNIRKTTKILDLGCGNGTWLRQLESIGFCNLYGVDKYIPDKLLKCKCKFYKGEIYDIPQKKFGLIALHHSFEHMENPRLVLRKICSLLEDSGICIIRIPVMGKTAWRKYGVNWYQIDAPRHAFLYTEKALKFLCGKEGLIIYDIKFDSEFGQFYVSEQYGKCKKSFKQICSANIKKEDLKKYRKWAKEANKRREGDQAIFYIRKCGKL